MTMDEHGVDQAVKAFFDNDPYYSRSSTAGSKDSALWDVFQSRYLEASNCFIHPKDANLPLSFIKKVTQGATHMAEAAQRSEADPGSHNE